MGGEVHKERFEKGLNRHFSGLEVFEKERGSGAREHWSEFLREEVKACRGKKHDEKAEGAQSVAQRS